jgi:predicted AAA+ superfamily ATPase
MESLYQFFYQNLSRTNTQFVRYLYKDIDWNNRLIGITGARGSGKTTLLFQHIKNTFGPTPKEALLASLDHLWFSNNHLLDLASEFVKQGGTHLFLDEVHKYPNWSQEIKNIYDNFPDLKVVFTGSSMLEIYKGNADLSRRAVHYLLHGMSFREYVLLEEKISFPVITLEELLNDHVPLSAKINEVIKPIPCFQSYLKQGYYPYYKEDKRFYLSKLLNTINIILESDLPAVENIEVYSIQKIKKLLVIISKIVPFTPNITDLSAQIGVSRNSLLNYLTILEKAQLINLLNQNTQGLHILAKPEKIYLNNTNLIYALEESKPEIGNLRESFFFNQLKAVTSITSSKETDFTVNNKYSFEIGGKNKGSGQIANLNDAFLALENIEYGFGNKIPLWLFGFLY